MIENLGEHKNASNKKRSFFALLDEWWRCASPIEKIFAFLIGFEVGDLLNDTWIKFFSIDSFIINTIIGVSSLLCTFVVFQLARSNRN